MFACLFDIDGTLLSSGGAGRDAMYAALEAEFGVEQPDGSVPFSGRTDRAIVCDMFKRHAIESSEPNWTRFLAAYLRHLPSALSRRNGCVLPGVATLLDQLGARSDIQVGLLTGNTRAGARAKLSHYRIDHYFEFGGFGDRHLDRADVARDALEELRNHGETQVDPGRVWVIGDTPLDIHCARSVGANILAVCTGLHSRAELAAERPDVLLDDLSESELLINLLR